MRTPDGTSLMGWQHRELRLWCSEMRARLGDSATRLAETEEAAGQLAEAAQAQTARHAAEQARADSQLADAQAAVRRHAAARSELERHHAQRLGQLQGDLAAAQQSAQEQSGGLADLQMQVGA